jgi:hypothetical protein
MRRYLLMFITFALTASVFFGWLLNEPSPLYWGVALEGLPTSSSLNSARAATHLDPQLVVIFQQWPAPDKLEQASFPENSINAIIAAGAVPCLTWEPFYLSGDQEVTILTSQLLSGAYDAYIDQYASTIKAWGHPLLIRLAHEMNLEKYHWGMEAEDFNEHSPALYISLYRYIVERFRRQKVHNALWVFCPNVDSVPADTTWNQVANYYPGNDVVDLFGMDGYGWDENGERTFSQTFGALFNELQSISPTKPIIVCETASGGDEENKMRWLGDAILTSRAWGIKAMAWFQVNKERDWRIVIPEDFRSSFNREPHGAQKWVEELLPSSR